MTYKTELCKIKLNLSSVEIKRTGFILWRILIWLLNYNNRPVDIATVSTYYKKSLNRDQDMHVCRGGKNAL